MQSCYIAKNVDLHVFLKGVCPPGISAWHEKEYAVGLLVAQLIGVVSELEMLQLMVIDHIVSLCDVPHDTSWFIPSFKWPLLIFFLVVNAYQARLSSSRSISSRPTLLWHRFLLPSPEFQCNFFNIYTVRSHGQALTLYHHLPKNCKFPACWDPSSEAGYSRVGARRKCMFEGHSSQALVSLIMALSLGFTP